jgi:hypothetical protein
MALPLTPQHEVSLFDYEFDIRAGPQAELAPNGLRYGHLTFARYLHKDE